MKIIFIVILIAALLLGLSFAQIFPKEVKHGVIHIDFWTWLQIKRGNLFMD